MRDVTRVGVGWVRRRGKLMCFKHQHRIVGITIKRLLRKPTIVNRWMDKAKKTQAEHEEDTGAKARRKNDNNSDEIT